jgi:hypothetical protein
MIKSRRMRWAGHVARMETTRNAYRILAGEPEGKRSLGRQRHRWVDNIKMDLREIGWGKNCDLPRGLKCIKVACAKHLSHRSLKVKGNLSPCLNI